MTDLAARLRDVLSATVTGALVDRIYRDANADDSKHYDDALAELWCDALSPLLSSLLEEREREIREINVNDYVWVKLQKRGLDAIAADPLDAAMHQHREERDGWTRWQWWQLMSTLGHLCIMGPPPPFETTIRLDARYPAPGLASSSSPAAPPQEK